MSKISIALICIAVSFALVLGRVEAEMNSKSREAMIRYVKKGLDADYTYFRNKLDEEYLHASSEERAVHVILNLHAFRALIEREQAIVAGISGGSDDPELFCLQILKAHVEGFRVASDQLKEAFRELVNIEKSYFVAGAALSKFTRSMRDEIEYYHNLCPKLASSSDQKKA